MRFELGGSGMTYEEVMKKAKSEIGPYCKVCPQCNGKACKNQMPGPGAKGVGDVAIRNLTHGKISELIWILFARM